MATWGKEGTFWTPAIFKEPSYNAVLEITGSADCASVHGDPDGSHPVWSLPASSAARWDSSLPEPQRASLGEKGETQGRDPRGRTTSSPRLPELGMDSRQGGARARKRTSGTWGERIQRRGREGSVIQVSRDSRYQMSVSRKPHAPDNPPSPKLN